MIINPWVHRARLLANLPIIRGSLFQDRFCAAAGDLIAVTGNEQEARLAPATATGNVWRINSAVLRRRNWPPPSRPTWKGW